LPAEPKSYAEKQLELHQTKRYECPVCGKIFDIEAKLNQHIQNSQTNDIDHAEFRKYFLNQKYPTADHEEKSEKSMLSNDIPQSTLFGRITVRKSRKK
jgi:hypothetical protein